MSRIFNQKFLKENYILFVFVFFVATKFLSLNFCLARTNHSLDVILSVSKLLCCAIFAFDAAWDILKRKRQINVLFVAVSICAVLTFLASGSATLIVLILLVYEMAKFNFKKVINLVYWTLLICYICIVCAALLGYVPNWVFYRDSILELRYSLGFTYASPAATIFMFLLLMRYYLKNFKLSLVENLINLLLTVCIYNYTDSRTSFIICLFIIIVSIIINVPLFAKINLENLLEKKTVKIILIALPILFLILWEAVTIMYHHGLSISDKIDQILTGRFFYTSKAFKEQPLTLFGTKIDWDGWGEYASLQDKSTFDYNYVDNSYMYILFSFGIVSLIVSVALYTYLIYKAIKDKDYSLLFILIIVLTNSMIETNLIELTLNWFVLYAGSLFIKKQEKLNNNTKG